jgi:Spy/CpxP family protein refolding chaperone
MVKRKVLVTGLAALLISTVGSALAADSANQHAATPACVQQQVQCGHEPGSPACREAHGNGQCGRGRAKCDPAKCADKCPGCPGHCDPAKCGQCDPAKCAEKCPGCPEQCDPAKCGGRCPGCPGGGHIAFCDPDKCIGGGAGCQFRQGLLAALDLSPEQQQAVDAARAKLLPEVRELRGQLATQREKLAELESAPEPDEAAIQVAHDTISLLRQQLQERVAAHMAEVRSLLTPDQQTRFDEAIQHCPVGRGGNNGGPAKCDPGRCHGQGSPCTPEDCARQQKDHGKSQCGRHSCGRHPGCPRQGAENAK